MIAVTMHPPAEPKPRASVLVVDDEPTIGEVVARYLERAGYRTRVAGDGPHALALCAQSAPDLVVLDVMLPGLDGLEVMRRLRERALAGACDPAHRPRPRVRADRRAAPRRRRLRRQAVLARRARRARGSRAAPRAPHAASAAPVLEFEGLRIEPATRRPWRRRARGRADRARVRPARVPRPHPGQVFSRDRLMELVWQLPDYTDSSTVTVHIRRLRAKLEPDPEHPRYVQTVWGVGYRFRPVGAPNQKRQDEPRAGAVDA